MKELVKKEQNMKLETIAVSHHYNAIMSNNFLVKQDDSGAFTIHCIICVFQFANVLCDLGKSIKLMSLAIFKKDVSVPLLTTS